MSRFPNRAGCPVDDNDRVLGEELTAAGIWHTRFAITTNDNPEVPTHLFASCGRWVFKRAWRYWVGTGPGLPLEAADRLCSRVGQTCRVDGQCVPQDPRVWCEGFACGLYHVDDSEGLLELANTIKEVTLRAGHTLYEGFGEPLPPPEGGWDRWLANRIVEIKAG